MKVLVLLTLVLSVASCAITKGAGSAAKECAAEVTPELATNVGAAFADNDYEALIEKEIRAYGFCLVRKAVVAFQSAAEKAAVDPAGRARARAWLANHPDVAR